MRDESFPLILKQRSINVFHINPYLMTYHFKEWWRLEKKTTTSLANMAAYKVGQLSNFNFDKV